MALSKNPGKLLTSVYSGLVDAIPQRWRSKLGIVRTTRQQPLDVSVSTITPSLVASSVEQEFTDERKKTDVTLNDPTGQTMVEYIQTKEGQVGTRTVSYVPEGTTPPSFDELTQEFSQEASGNGWSEQILVTVPNLFDAYDYSIERRDTVPPEFGALLKTRETSHTIAGTAAMPTLGAGELMRREVQVTEDIKRVILRARDLASLPMSLTSYDTDEAKEIVVIIKTWQLDSVAAIAPTATTDTKWDNLGDGTAVQTVAAKAVFAHPVYGIERTDRVPADFGALLEVTETSTTSAGTISPPSLAAGELMRREEQITVFTKRITVRARDLASLPIQLVNKDTSRAKQVVTITRIWELASVTPAVPTATLDVSFERLGDGTAIETRKSEAVFPGPVYSKSIENLIPSKFRAHIATKVSEITSTGTANPTPTLATGELSHEEQQVDAFNIRTKSVTLGTLSLPVTFTDTELTEQFGGGVLDVIYKLNVSGTYTVDEGLRIVTSELTDLGNGYEILTTKRLQDSEWPELPGQDYDEQFDVIIPFTDQVVPVGTDIGSPRIKITPKNAWRQENHEIDVSAISTVFDAYNLVFPGTTNLNGKLPDILTDLESVFEVNSGNGSYSETGAGYWNIRGSYALSIRGSGNGSAAVVSDATFLLLPPFKPAASVTRVVFLLPNPVTSAAVLAKLTVILGAAVNAWPDFDPKPVTVVCTSRKVSVRAEANQHTQSGGSGITPTDGDPCTEFDCVTCDASSTTGTGTSTEVGITIKTIRIPPCLHGAIAINDSQDENATAQAYANDGSSWGSCAPPEFGPADTGMITLTATGTVVATASATAITAYPSGKYLVDTNAQPYKLGYAMIHAEVVEL